MRFHCSGARVAGRPLGVLCALACLLLVPLPSAAASGPGAGQLPTARQFDSRTGDFLRSLPPQRRSHQRGGGGLGSSTDTGDGAGTTPVLGKGIMVSYYGAPQLGATVVGKLSPKRAARKLKRQAKGYKRFTRGPVQSSINLIGSVALASPGNDRLYRSRQEPRVINRYLKAARSVGARLMLDIQPGRSTILAELRALRPWLSEPDVDIGIDPEWNVGRKGVPGRTAGRVTARELNLASAYVQNRIEDEGLPPKALIVHQFREGTIKGRRRVKQRPDVSVTLNFDGIGSPAAKKAGYKNLAQPGLFDGFSLFFDRDSRLLSPRSVSKIRPTVDFVMYQ